MDLGTVFSASRLRSLLAKVTRPAAPSKSAWGYRVCHPRKTWRNLVRLDPLNGGSLGACKPSKHHGASYNPPTTSATNSSVVPGAFFLGNVGEGARDLGGAIEVILLHRDLPTILCYIIHLEMAFESRSNLALISARRASRARQ